MQLGACLSDVLQGRRPRPPVGRSCLTLLAGGRAPPLRQVAYRLNHSAGIPASRSPPSRLEPDALRLSAPAQHSGKPPRRAGAQLGTESVSATAAPLIDSGVMNTLNRHNPLTWLGVLLLAWLVLGVQLAAPKVASGPFYAATEHHLGVTRWEAAPRLGLDAWTTKSTSGVTVVAKGATTVIDTAPMAQKVMDIRAGLPSDLRRSGNVAVAEIDIPGLPKQMAAHSQVSEAGKGLIGSGSGNFTAQTVPNKAGDMVYRGIDTEYKILDNIADKLGSNTSARGTVNILTEKPACASCLNVVEQFKAKYPNITVNMLDNQGVMLRPPRKTP